MEERSEGIILRTRPLTETSLIVQWITPELGRLATVAKGARRPKSPFAGKLDLGFRAQFSFQRSRRSELHVLREARVTRTHPGLRSNFALLHQAAYFTVLIEQGTERETPLPEIHALLADYLDHLPADDRISEAMFVFEFQFLRLLGVQPEIRHELLEKRFAEILPIPGHQRQELNRVLRVAIGTSLQRLPPQRQRALQASASRPA
jgi:DNA repair protein RecO (recombination protein O)